MQSQTGILVTAGVAAIILAVVGGGAEAFGVKVPVLGSHRRQVLLALVGIAFLAGAVLVDWKENENTSNGSTVAEQDPAVAAYRQHVLAACDALAARTESQPPSTIGFEGLTYNRGEFLDWMRDERRFTRRTLESLWQRDVPEDLSELQAEARAAGNAVLSGWKAAIQRLESELPGTWTYQPPGPQPGPLRRAEQELASLGQRLRGAMAALANGTCGAAATDR
jgi:hypothetical protein